MKPERWREINQILHKALELDSAERENFFRTVCLGDDELRGEIDSLWQYIEDDKELRLDQYSTPNGFSILTHARRANECDIDRRDFAPNSINRYQVQNELGRGGSAVVYLAHDPQLDRQVALKVLDREGLLNTVSVDQFTREARNTAQLEHVGIVRTYDVNEDGQGRIYIVQEYIDGEDLGSYLRKNSVSWEQAARLMAAICDAIGYAHSKHFWHRDLKPENILLDQAFHPHIADFGLSLHAMRQSEHVGEIAGTPSYMSPEQVRGESHRLDGRSDLWSLGIVFYKLLTGRLPFLGDTYSELFEEIQHRNVQPPHMLVPAVPPELARICMLCLEKKLLDRYQTAAELKTDLLQWLDSSKRAASSADTDDNSVLPAVIPKGLRSFDQNDAEFFMHLLPGPVDRNGIPACVRFWKTRIESRSRDTFSVGLLYGPSGCGKSSLVKAGLLPVLTPKIHIVYVECSLQGTIDELIERSQQIAPELARFSRLDHLIAHVRTENGLGNQKVVIILDQFEQCFFDETAQHELQKALRQCDGANVQCLVLVRDDFFVSINRFFQELEVPILEGANAALVDLVESAHAKHILRLFGQAYGKIPINNELSDSHSAFLDRVIELLTANDRIVCIQLVVFAEIMKRYSWTPESLERLGGIVGLGESFLDESFHARSAPPSYRIHQDAAMRVLAELLPEQTKSIGGKRKTYDELLSSSGYTNRPDDFASLVDVLDKQVRLITPTDQTPSENNKEGRGQQQYQLSHDFLVPSIRNWLNSNRRSTIRGRAELLLEERAEIWDAVPSRKHFPTLWEYIRIRLFAGSKTWSKRQRQMMKETKQRITRRLLVVTVLLAVSTFTGYEVYGRHRASLLISELFRVDDHEVAEKVEELNRFHRWAEGRLQRYANQPAQTSQERHYQFRSLMALASRDKAYVDEAIQSIFEVEIPQVATVCQMTKRHEAKAWEHLWHRFRDDNRPPDQRFRAGIALAILEGEQATWTHDDFSFLVQRLIASSPEIQPKIRDYLRPVANELTPLLENLLTDRRLRASQLNSVAFALVDYSAHDSKRLVRFLPKATSDQFEILFTNRFTLEMASEILMKTASREPSENLKAAERVLAAKQRAKATIGLLRLGAVQQAIDILHQSQNREFLSQFADGCRSHGLPAEELLGAFDYFQSKRRVDRNSDNHLFYTLLIALGEFPIDEIPPRKRRQLVSQLFEWFDHDGSAAVHGGTGWLLRSWGFVEDVANRERMEAPYSAEREWFRLAVSKPNGKAEADTKDLEGAAAKIMFDFVILPAHESKPVNEDSAHGRHRIAISSHEITWQQFEYANLRLPNGQTHRQGVQTATHDPDLELPPLSDDMPAAAMNWYEAVQFCRIVSSHMGIAEPDLYYQLTEPDERMRRDVVIKPDGQGIRLLTADEWEFACRSASNTKYSFGDDEQLFAKFGQSFESSTKYYRPVRQLRPSFYGLSDMHGNVSEWCNDWFGPLATNSNGLPPEKSKVIRGGGWNNTLTKCGTTMVLRDFPNRNNANTGFRVALEISEN